MIVVGFGLGLVCIGVDSCFVGWRGLYVLLVVVVNYNCLLGYDWVVVCLFY